MKERGIIFTAWSIPKIMDGIKTQTRRVIKASNSTVLGDAVSKNNTLWTGLVWDDRVYNDKGPHILHPWLSEYLHVPWVNPDDSTDDDDRVFRVRSRYEVGDRLWVRETWAEQGGDIYYKADWSDTKPVNMVYNNIKWRSSSFMPRWASRIDLEITEVRAERLKAISVLDLIKEGIEPQYEFDTNAYNEPPMFEEFIALWDSLNPRCPWSANNWVWPISFKEVK